MTDAEARALVAPQLFDGERWHEQMALVLRDGQIEALLPAGDLPAGLPAEDFPSGMLAPGFIDLQVNGGGDLLFNNAPNADALEVIARAHRSGGTTSLLPTLLSDSPEVHRAGAEAVASARRSGNQGILGIHLEGPFFAASRRGTHSADALRELTAGDLDWLKTLPAAFPTILTLAPETVPLATIAQLSAAGLLLCAGHTDATWEQVEAAREAGLRGFTHLFNAMSPLSARAPGAVGAALAADDCWAGLIADGHHVHPASLKVALRALPAGKACLVSDAMATVGGERSEFQLYGETIRLQDGRLVNAEGRLAGSAITLGDAVRFCRLELGLPLGECLRMASLYPATFLGLDGQLGRLAPGYRADLLRLDSECRVLDSWVAGEHLAHR